MSEDEEQGWAARGWAALRSTARVRRSTRELRERLFDLRDRALDEIVSRIAQRPVNTTVDQVLGRRKRLESTQGAPEASENAAPPATEASRPSSPAAPRPRRERRETSGERFVGGIEALSRTRAAEVGAGDPAPLEGVAAKDERTASKSSAAPTTEVEPAVSASGPAESSRSGRSSSKRRKRRRRRKPSVESPVQVHLLPQGPDQVYATWTLDPKTSPDTVGVTLEVLPAGGSADARPVATMPVDEGRGDAFLRVPVADARYVVRLRVEGEVAAESRPIAVPPRRARAPLGERPVFLELGEDGVMRSAAPLGGALRVQALLEDKTENDAEPTALSRSAWPPPWLGGAASASEGSPASEGLAASASEGMTAPASEGFTGPASEALVTRPAGLGAPASEAGLLLAAIASDGTLHRDRTLSDKRLGAGASERWAQSGRAQALLAALSAEEFGAPASAGVLEAHLGRWQAILQEGGEDGDAFEALLAEVTTLAPAEGRAALHRLREAWANSWMPLEGGDPERPADVSRGPSVERLERFLDERGEPASLDPEGSVPVGGARVAVELLRAVRRGEAPLPEEVDEGPATAPEPPTERSPGADEAAPSADLTGPREAAPSTDLTGPRKAAPLPPKKLSARKLPARKLSRPTPTSAPAKGPDHGVAPGKHLNGHAAAPFAVARAAPRGVTESLPAAEKRLLHRPLPAEPMRSTRPASLKRLLHRPLGSESDPS